jgi:mRNA interferase RelE/StbE
VISVEWDDRARRELRALDRLTQSKILLYVRETLAGGSRRGRPLSGPPGSLRCYRLGGYSLVCHVGEAAVLVLVLRATHRRDARR